MNNAVKCYEMVGESMSPFLQEGDSLLVKEVNPKENLCLGDCLVYSSSDIKKVCHRLVKIKGEKLYLKGDNVPQVDSPVSPEDILGRVVAIKKADKLIILDTFLGRGKAILAVYLSLFSIRCGFLSRWLRILYYSPKEIIYRLKRKWIT